MKLTMEQLARMSRLLEEVIELDDEGRRRWLETLPPEHADLREALNRSLLSPQTLPLETLFRIDHGPPTGRSHQAGATIGPYRLIRPLGVGGMAEVWLAQRADGSLKRDIALKLPMLSRKRKDLASRFERERDILADLEHPNIARLYDAGVSPDGLPYLAMEFVAGQPLTSWCDARCLSIPERLTLFLEVLDAVSFAHARRVIHRDLKPSNIMVNESGQVRLLDFGVAKLLLGDDEEQTRLTQLFGLALTPEYASPELIRGQTDEGADVYALGVVLYELLCGSRPYPLEPSSSRAMLERAISAVLVKVPSSQLATDAGMKRGTTQDRLARQLRGDLDAIVLKALAKLPEQRYPSAVALADDLQRYLHDEPVFARPARLTYRVSKFLTRHRTGLVTGTAVAALLVTTAAFVLNKAVAPARTEARAGGSSTDATSNTATETKIVVLASPSDSSGTGTDDKSMSFARDLSASLRRSVAHFGWPVVASSSVAPTDREQRQRLARQFGARYLVAAQPQYADGRAKVDLQILEGSTGSEAWVGRTETPKTKTIQITDLALLRSTAVLRRALYEIEQRRIVNAPLDRLSPRELVVRADAIEIANSLDRDTVTGLYAEAMQRDSNLVQALVGWADKLQRVAAHGDSARIQEADDFSIRAVQLAPDDPYAWSVRGWVLWSEYRFDAALAANARALELDPADALYYAQRALLAISTGQPQEALPILEQARDIDPTIAGYALRLGCRALLSLGRYDEAVQNCERASALDESWLAHMYLTAAYAQKGDLAHAAEARERLLRQRPDFTLDALAVLMSEPDALRFREQWDKHVMAGLRKAGIPEN
jgi:serine/threonine protein kinase/tetratricopeptide (TPR) repeat protein